MGVALSTPLALNITDPSDYTIVTDSTYGCADNSLVEELDVILTMDVCNQAALDRPSVAAYQWSGDVFKCYLYSPSCFSGPRTKGLDPEGNDRGDLNIIYELTPSYLRVKEENEFQANLTEILVNTSMPTPGFLFKLADDDKNQLLTAEEVEGLASTFGNALETGFTLKGGLLSNDDIQGLMNTYFNCRAPNDMLDFGEVYDAVMDTTEKCQETGATNYFVDRYGRVPSATMAHTKYTRDELLFGFTGLQLPECPSYGDLSTDPPAAPPPAPCLPFEDSFVETRDCGPFEESYNNNAVGSPIEITVLDVNTSLTDAEQYTYCLERCCDQKFNKVYGNTECEGVFYTWINHKCYLYGGSFDIVEGTDNNETYTVTAKLLPKYTPRWEREGARALMGMAHASEDEGGEEKDEEEDGSVEVDEPRQGSGIETELSSPASHRAMLGAEPSFPTLAPAPAAMPAAVLNVGLALAPLVALLLGALVGRSRRAGRTDDKVGAVQM